MGSIGEKSCDEIESVALDGARTYIASTKQHAANAIIVYDKFHIMQKLNEAVDKIRKYELRKARKEGDENLICLTNCRQRFILFKKRSDLSARQSKYLEELCRINKPIYKAMLLKESFLGIYKYNDPAKAESYLKSWIEEAMNSSLEAFQKLAESFSDKFQYIINWFKKRISSAISEGINNAIKRLKCMAYGYKDVEYFLLKIHQRCGLLNTRGYSH